MSFRTIRLSATTGRCGCRLKPKVRCVIQLNHQGSGNPDGGLFITDQFDRKTNALKNPLSPSRGVIEVKAPAEALDDTAAPAQVDKYWAHHKLVLVTNLRDWLLASKLTQNHARICRTQHRILRLSRGR